MAEAAEAFMESPDFMYPGMKEDLPAGAIEGTPDGGWPDWCVGEFAIVPAKSCPNNTNCVNFDGYLKAAKIPWAGRKVAATFAGNPSWLCEVEDDKCFMTGVSPKKPKKQITLGEWQYYNQNKNSEGKQRSFFEKVELDGEEVLCWTVVQLRWSEPTKKVVKKPIGDREQMKVVQRRWPSKDAKGNDCMKFEMTMNGEESSKCLRYMRKVKDASGEAVAYND